jgi:hypothetical protein
MPCDELGVVLPSSLLKFNSDFSFICAFRSFLDPFFMFYVLFFLFPIPMIGTVVRYRATYYPLSIKEQLTPSLSTVGAKDLAVSREPVPDLEGGSDAKLSGDASARDVQNPPPTFWGVFTSVWRHEVRIYYFTRETFT